MGVCTRSKCLKKKGQPSHSPRSLLVVRFCGYLETIQNGAGQMVEPNVLAQSYMSRTSFCLFSLFTVSPMRRKKRKNRKFHWLFSIDLLFDIIVYSAAWINFPTIVEDDDLFVCVDSLRYIRYIISFFLSYVAGLTLYRVLFGQYPFFYINKRDELFTGPICVP